MFGIKGRGRGRVVVVVVVVGMSLAPLFFLNMQCTDPGELLVHSWPGCWLLSWPCPTAGSLPGPQLGTMPSSLLIWLHRPSLDVREHALHGFLDLLWGHDFAMCAHAGGHCHLPGQLRDLVVFEVLCWHPLLLQFCLVPG